MSIIDDVKPIIDEGRASIDDVGLRLFRVYVRITDWNGQRVGLENKTVTLRELTVARGRRPKVKQVPADRVVAAGYELGATVFEVTLTPAYPGGGVDPEDISPPQAPDGVRREVVYLVYGPGHVDGSVCELVSLDTGSPFRIMARLRVTGGRP